jgi:hypothetical protein
LSVVNSNIYDVNIPVQMCGVGNVRIIIIIIIIIMQNLRFKGLWMHTILTTILFNHLPEFGI